MSNLMNHFSHKQIVFLCLLVSLAFTGCSFEQAVQVLKPTATTEIVEILPTQSPSQTPTPIIMGTLENPYIIGEINATGSLSQDLSLFLNDKTGVYFSQVAFADYTQLVDAVRGKKVALAWLPPLTYIFLKQDVGARPLLLTNQNGFYYYGTQFYANVDSGLSIAFDPDINSNEVGAESSNALAQFTGLRPCFVSETSVSGYLLPLNLLKANNIQINEPVFSQSHASVIRALYTKGICDFGATFSHLGDPRTSSSVLSDMPDAVEKIPIIYRSEPIIPNINISAFESLPQDLDPLVISAILDLLQTDNGLVILSGSSGYNISSMKQIDDSAYTTLREIINSLGFNPADAVGY